MKLSLPMPSRDPAAYKEILERGLKRFPERRENYIKYKNSLRNAVVLDYLPVNMDYEAVSRCNFRCVMCRINDWKNGKRAEDMSLADYKNSLDELYGLVEVKLQGAGEPLLHPDIFDMISIAAERDIWTRITVNGSLLHINNNYKRLIDANPGEVQISIDGADKEVFEKIRRGSNFERIVSNAALINEYAESTGALKTRSWTVVQKENAHQLEGIVKLGHRMKFKRMTFCLAMSAWGIKRWGEVISAMDASQTMTAEKTLSLIELGKSLGIEVTFWYSSSKFKKTEPCLWLFERAFISSDMRIVPCCVFSSPDVADFGDARKFSKEWNNDSYQKFRKAHIEGKIPDYCRACYE